MNIKPVCHKNACYMELFRLSDQLIVFLGHCLILESTTLFSAVYLAQRFELKTTKPSAISISDQNFVKLALSDKPRHSSRLSRYEPAAYLSHLILNPLTNLGNALGPLILSCMDSTPLF